MRRNELTRRADRVLTPPLFDPRRRPPLAQPGRTPMCYGNALTASHKPNIPQLVTTIVLIAAAFLGGALNSLAGGGTLVTFPTLLLAGLDPNDGGIRKKLAAKMT